MDQSQLTMILIGAAVLILLVAVFVGWQRSRRSQTLKEKFGSEYDRTVEQHGKRGPAEAALEERAKRVEKLEIRPLTPQERDDAVNDWREVKAVFVDSPVEAVHHADRLLAKLMRARGYPMADFDRRYEDLTVDHPDVARHYREGHEITLRHEQGKASTEELRQAMIHFEALFDDLVDEVAPDPAAAPAPAR